MYRSAARLQREGRESDNKAGTMTGLVEEIQKAALDPKVPVSTLLRQVKLAAVKLRQRSRFTEAPSAAVPNRIRHEVTHRLPAGTSGIGGKVARAGQKDR